MRSTRAGFVAILLSLAGIGACIYLSIVHLGMFRGELLGGAACGAAGSAFNCHAVTASPIGNPFGIPLAYWGLIGYVATLSLGLIACQLPESGTNALIALTGVALLLVIVDLGLLAAMLVVIRYLCPLCLGTYGINLALLATAKIGTGRSWSRLFQELPVAAGALIPRPRAAAAWLFWGMVLTGAAGAGGLHASTMFLVQGSPGALRNQMLQYVRQQGRITVQTAGDPQQGPDNGSIRVVEFSDFLCPSCQRAFKFNPIVFASHRQQLSFTFKHFPLDMECNSAVNRSVHPGACRIAAASECAHEQGKFWQMHDAIFEKGPQYQAAQLESDAARIGLDVPKFQACLQSGRGMEAVRRDVAEAVRLGVTSTPTFVVNGVLITGALTPTTFDELLSAIRETGQRQ